MKHKSLFLITSLLSIALIISCKKSSPQPDEVPDKISLEMFMSLKPLTFRQLNTANAEILTQNPSIESNQTLYIRELYIWAKEHPSPAPPAIIEDSPIAQTLLQLTYEEWKVIFSSTVSEVYGGAHSKDLSADAVQTEYSCDSDATFDHSKKNSIYHSYWNAMMVRHSSPEFAEEFATAHESESPPSALNTLMDLHNNEIGRQLALKNPDATDEELLQILIRQKFVFIQKKEDLVNAEGALVFFVAKRQFDVHLTGTMSNPETGEPWNATFDFNQCGDVLRGNYTIIRNTSTQQRRFSGTLNQDGSIELNVSNPYKYENPDNLIFCENIKISLKGNETQLTGSWTSSNCSQGGILNLHQ